jgi:hypothetical protein
MDNSKKDIEIGIIGSPEVGRSVEAIHRTIKSPEIEPKE